MKSMGFQEASETFLGVLRGFRRVPRVYMGVRGVSGLLFGPEEVSEAFQGFSGA